MKLYFFSLVIILLGFISCDQKSATKSEKVLTVTVLSSTIECKGMTGDECLQYYRGVEPTIVEYKKNNIPDFDYQEGYEYVLRIRETPQENSDLTNWEVLEIIDKKIDESLMVVPEDVTAKYYKNAEIKYSVMRKNASIVPGNKTVFKYNRVAEQNKQIADDEFSENLFFQVENPADGFSTTNSPEKFNTVYGYYCFCPDVGVKPVMQGSIAGKAVGDKYEVEMNFPSQSFEISDPKTRSKQKMNVFDSEWSRTVTFSEGKLEMKNNNLPESAMRLHDLWLLTELMGKNVNKMDLSKQPLLEFYPGDGRFTGSDGCNVINGAIKNITSTDIRFDQIISTKKACPVMIGSQLSEALSDTRIWKIEDNKLKLSNAADKKLAIFQKVD